jgi:hypothetical protein
LMELIRDQHREDTGKAYHDHPFGREVKRAAYALAGDDRIEVGGHSGSREPVLDEVVRNETIDLIRSSLPAEVADTTLDLLESGQWTDDQARACIAAYRGL